MALLAPTQILGFVRGAAIGCLFHVVVPRSEGRHGRTHLERRPNREADQF